MYEAHEHLTEDAQFTRLMREGRTAFGHGNYKQAHNLWRQAAATRPDNEQVWWALLTVVSDEEDRRVCLENIYAINPRSKDVLRELRTHQRRYGRTSVNLPPDASQRMFDLLRALWNILVVIVALVGLFMLGVLIGVLLNLL
jgi:hypothetical protein